MCMKHGKKVSMRELTPLIFFISNEFHQIYMTNWIISCKGKQQYLPQQLLINNYFMFKPKVTTTLGQV